VVASAGWGHEQLIDVDVERPRPGGAERNGWIESASPPQVYLLGMRMLWLITGTLVAAIGLVSGAGATVSASSDGAFGKALFDLAWRANIRVGFEPVPGCSFNPRQRPFPKPDASPSAGSAPDLLNNLLSDAPDFSWHEMDGVFVVRPKPAWKDPNNALNFQTAPFDLAGLDLDSALRR
jgi:hypothetical protein